MEKAKPERLILKIPKWFWKLIERRSVAFCMTRTRAVSLIFVLIALGVLEVVFAYYVYIPFPVKVTAVILWGILFSLAILLVLPSIFIRKDCFECQFGFHIIAHERNHMNLGKSDEVAVEEQTLKQTGTQLIPILLSNPKICKGCPFLWRKMYCHAVFNYLEEARK